jgi:cellulose 1,4-beta-cellobiosidase
MPLKSSPGLTGRRRARRGIAVTAAFAFAAAMALGTGPATADVTAAARVDNPYAGATVYVNPDWSAKARADGGSSIANQPTFVWMDRIAAINGVNGVRGLRAHLDNALSQAAGRTMVVQFVIYNLPGRDCAALASNGELRPDDLPRYKSEYIDPIAAIMGESKYANLRIVTIIEIDSPMIAAIGSMYSDL